MGTAPFSEQGHGVRVRVKACAKTFPDGTRALEPLDLDIPAGQTVVFLGPSGCGKTTTLRIIAGLERPDRGGRVYFDDEDVTAQPIERRTVGMVFQSYALFPNLTVAGNIGYGLRIRKLPKLDIEARVGELLEMMHISELRDRRIDQLSGGQRQRVALARALAVRPRVLLLDEPLTALDAKLRESLRTEIDTLLRKLRITVVYVTHDQAEAMALGDRIVVMSRGRIAQQGTPRDIYFSPENRFVAEFVGTTNWLTGRVADQMVVAGSLALPLPEQSPAMPEGAGVDVLFRPEDVDLSSSESAHLTGFATNVFFMGDRIRFVLEGPESSQIIIETGNRAEVRQGDIVHVRIARYSIRSVEPR